MMIFERKKVGWGLMIKEQKCGRMKNVYPLGLSSLKEQLELEWSHGLWTTYI